MTTVKDRFEQKFIPEPNSGCWLWTAGGNNLGYGRMRVNGHMCGAHRISYELYIGPIPTGMHVLHNCDVRCCVNPSHLFIGSHSDNMRDMWQKGRHVRPQGTTSGKSKLTNEDVISIRNDNRMHAEIAKDYDVDRSNVTSIKSRKTWKHI